MPQTGAIAVALVPSTQHSGVPGIYVEGTNCLAVAQITASKLIEAGIAVRVFWSQDGSLETLAALYRQADRWVQSRPEPIRCIVSQHSDSGTFSHVFGIFGRRADAALACAIATELGPVFRAQDVRVFDHLGSVDYSTYLAITETTAASVIIEDGSHENESDRAILTSPAGQQQIAEATVKGIVTWATR